MAGGYTLRETPGVTIDKLPSGAWRVRWRTDGKQRSKTRPTQGEAERLAREVAAAKLRREVPVVEAGATLDAVIAGWLRDRKRYGCAPGTLRRYHEATKRILQSFRELHGIPETAAVPGSVLTRDGIPELTNHLRTGDRPLSEGTLRVTLRCLADAWVWASDDPTAYPRIAPAPRARGQVVPRGATYVAPEAPTMAHVDAALEHCSPVGRPAAIVMRATGLRVSQVRGIRVEDLDARAATLVIRVGKSAHEKAARRTVPIPAHLATYLGELAIGQPAEASLVPMPYNPDRVLGRAWEAASEAGQVPREVWAPESRGHARPNHAFRAAYQAHLRSQGIAEAVIDALVGHQGGLRDAHYASAETLTTAMRAAVATIPEPPGAAEEDRPRNVVPIR